MKRKPLRRFKIAFVFVASSASALCATWSGSEWKYRQDFSLERAGVVTFPIPLESLDRAQSDLRDLRLVGPDSQEIPIAIFEPEASPPRWEKPRQFQVTLADHATIVTVEAGEDRIWESLKLESSSPRFMKAARLEASHDGKTWEEWSSGLPFFRQDGAEQLNLDLRKEPAAWFRVTLQDEGKTRIVVVAGKLLVPALEDNSNETFPVTIGPIETTAEESVMTLTLPAANLDLKELRIVSPEALFKRETKLGWPELREGEIAERMLSSDTVYRLAVNPGLNAEKTSVSVNSVVPGRKIFLHFANHDSPPLAIERVQAVRRVLLVGFSAPIAGHYTFWTGNSGVSSPHYDLSAAEGSLRTVAPLKVVAGALVENPQFAEVDSLAGLGLEAGPLPKGNWSSHRPIALVQAGVQTVDLDLAVLSSAQPNLADLRLVRTQKQIPYLVERTGLKRWIDLDAATAPDAARPTVSRWKIVLPNPRARIGEISLFSSNPLFNRRIQILETRESPTGESETILLGAGDWRRTQKNAPDSLVVTVAPPTEKTIFIEIENGDNPPLALDRVRASYFLTRLIFRSESVEPIELLSGNSEARAPKYDLALVADVLISSDKHSAKLSAIEHASNEKDSSALPKSALFWGALSIVVASLLFIVAKMLPKPPGPKT